MDAFSANTPIGETSFTNIVATLDPHVDRRLILAAHYDSKIVGGTRTTTRFLGATDSALPCALLLDLAHSLNSKLQTRKVRNPVWSSVILLVSWRVSGFILTLLAITVTYS